ncbi:galactosyldiacylglycerol synthase [Nocardioides sp. GY 10127]|uniref:MGDG synthase family glycosyltransferase n=1 Tax=Nocardioides sp. GY 10127 TaxID=2569762 RepID=UPI0010A7E10B|nr:galactosyldiacylglycerol synthase [Nocardioides sp. GY 10127]TIC79293.1 galactosyldiacylglycerol synthase [Nocardioides sp. GY 10127]
MSTLLVPRTPLHPSRRHRAVAPWGLPPVTVERDGGPGEPAAPGRTGGTVLVVTGSYGAGHDAAAAQVARAVVACGGAARVVDVVDLFPLGIGRALRRLYFAQLAVCPSTWRRLLGLLERTSGPSGLLARALLLLLRVLPARGLLAEVAGGRAGATHTEERADAVVSTHPFAGQALGRLRARGRLDVPVLTYLTDASVHGLWIAPGVDGHVAIHEEAALQALARGAAGVRLVAPLLPSAREHDAGGRARLRAAWAVGQRPVALVVGGSEGAGDLLGTVRDLLGTGLVHPVVVCGRNEGLRAALAGVPGVTALGWLDGLSAAIDAADLVVQNSGGFTTLETLQRGRPLLSYRCLPGHGEENARALRAEGLAEWPQDASALAAAVTRALAVTGARTTGWAARPRFADVLAETLPTASPPANGLPLDGLPTGVSA